MLGLSLLRSADEVAEQTERLRLAREQRQAELDAARSKALPMLQELFALLDADGCMAASIWRLRAAAAVS